MTDAPLAAIRFVDQDVDALIAEVAARLSVAGWRVAGVLQSRGVASAECRCADMDLTSIQTGQVFRISQPLGNGSHGCRLDPGALAQVSADLDRALDARPDLLILNRFGRGESEGRGFRDLIARALAEGIPVLTALRPTYAEAWGAFGDGFACDLPLDLDAVLAWATNQRETRNAA